MTTLLCDLAARVAARREALARLRAENHALRTARDAPARRAARVLGPMLVVALGAGVGLAVSEAAAAIPTPDPLVGPVSWAADALSRPPRACNDAPEPSMGVAISVRSAGDARERSAEVNRLQRRLDDATRRTLYVRRSPPRCHMLDGTKVASCEPGDSLCSCD